MGGHRAGDKGSISPLKEGVGPREPLGSSKADEVYPLEDLSS